MRNEPEVLVLRYGHRPGRDDRMTTHVGLTARALGADGVVFPSNASQPGETVGDIVDRFGGPFEVKLVTNQRAFIRDWDGRIVHLTMYGERIQDVQEAIRSTHRSEPLLVVVGGAKVPFELYENADFNVAVTNQPHSEIAGLAVFLDRLFEGRQLDQSWNDADRRIIPRSTGKKVIDATEDSDSVDTP